MSVECYCQGRLVPLTDVKSIPFMHLGRKHHYQLRRMHVTLFFNESWRVNAEKTRITTLVQPMLDDNDAPNTIEAQIINVNQEVTHTAANKQASRAHGRRRRAQLVLLSISFVIVVFDFVCCCFS